MGNFLHNSSLLEGFFYLLLEKFLELDESGAGGFAFIDYHGLGWWEVKPFFIES